jgi:hypothetical protein
MIPDLDIFRSANLLMQQHGEDTLIEAAMRADKGGGLWPGISPVALLSRILMEMFFQLWAESFGPLAERVFGCSEDDGCSTGTLFILSKDRAAATSHGLPGHI